MKNLCNLCPRKCNIDRTNNVGFCNSSENLKIAKVMIHYFEEPIISGDNNLTQNGSGTIFFLNSINCSFVILFPQQLT